jgi:subtilisin family serine protease
MKKHVILGVTVISAVILGGAVFASADSDTPSRKIVVFREGVSDAEKDSAIARHGEKIETLGIIHAKSAFLSKTAAREIAHDKNVLRVDDDIVIEAVKDINENKSGGNTFARIQSVQTLPWGVARIGANQTWASTTGSGIKVAVIDTGIDLAHPDLKGHIKGSYNAISPRKSATDDNGHGTHVAGIIGAINNTFGVVGVAPNVNLYAVKVLDRNGSGYLSNIIKGMDWAIANHMNVINMSFGSATGNQSFADAVKRVHDAGIVQVAAAGNSGGAVIFPAAYPEVIAVSATDNTDAPAYFTSHGPEVDIAAPGVNIFSTYKGGTYATLSGTSMASPHVAGTAALVLSRSISPAYDTFITDGKWEPEEVLKKMEDTSTDFGLPGWDEYFGYGLVNAFTAAL